MNQLIILGNGFDLSHGLKTSYSDFLFWYVKELYQQGNIDSKLIRLRHEFNASGLPQWNNINEIIEYVSKAHHAFSFGIVTEFAQTLIYRDNPNWVDIELAYYEQLKSMIKKYHELETLKNEVKSLNEQFYELREKLKEYLIAHVLGEIEPIKRINNYSKWFRLLRSNVSEEESMLILNFNYTNTFRELYTNCLSENDWIIDIHGQVISDSNPIIFGYGDELDKTYLEMENMNANELLTYVKSFWYLRTHQHKSLVEFLKSNSYDVHLFGHSCALSDRTLLNNIFEQNQCNSITIHHHNNIHDYTQKSYALSRTFNDKQKMRDIIQPFDESNVCPQFDE